MPGQGDADAPATLDVALLDRLAELAGDDAPAFRARIVEVFLERLDLAEVAFEGAATRHEADRIAARAHEIKSSSAQLGALALSEACRTLEASASGAGADLAQALQRFREEARAARRALAPYRTSPAPEAHVEPTEEGRPILIVEDDPGIAQIATRVLARAGHRVEVVSDGVAALARLETHPFAAVVTDVRMPRMSGTTLTERLRGDARWRSIPVVVITGSPNARLDAWAAGQPLVEVVRKPFSPRALAERVRSMLDAADARRTT